MAVYTIDRFAIRPEARDAAERAMHEHAMEVRSALADSAWSVFRDPHAPAKYMALSRADHPAADELRTRAPCTQAFLAAIRPLLAGEIETTEYELVTSSDLAPRHRSPPRARSRSARRR